MRSPLVSALQLELGLSDGHCLRGGSTGGPGAALYAQRETRYPHLRRGGRGARGGRDRAMVSAKEFCPCSAAAVYTPRTESVECPRPF